MKQNNIIYLFWGLFLFTVWTYSTIKGDVRIESDMKGILTVNVNEKQVFRTLSDNWKIDKENVYELLYDSSCLKLRIFNYETFKQIVYQYDLFLSKPYYDYNFPCFELDPFHNELFIAVEGQNDCKVFKLKVCKDVVVEKFYESSILITDIAIGNKFVCLYNLSGVLQIFDSDSRPIFQIKDEFVENFKFLNDDILLITSSLKSYFLSTSSLKISSLDEKIIFEKNSSIYHNDEVIFYNYKIDDSEGKLRCINFGKLDLNSLKVYSNEFNICVDSNYYSLDVSEYTIANENRLYVYVVFYSMDQKNNKDYIKNYVLFIYDISDNYKLVQKLDIQQPFKYLLKLVD